MTLFVWPFFIVFARSARSGSSLCGRSSRMFSLATFMIEGNWLTSEMGLVWSMSALTMQR